MKKLSKIVSIILSLALCLGMASPAFAASFSQLQEAIDDTDSSKGTAIVDEEGRETGRYGYAHNEETNQYGIEAWNSEDGTRNIQLNEDVTRTPEDGGFDKSSSINIGTVHKQQSMNPEDVCATEHTETVVIDLNGNDINGKCDRTTNEGYLQWGTVPFDSVIRVGEGGSLTINDSKAHSEESQDENGDTTSTYVSGKITGGNGKNQTESESENAPFGSGYGGGVYVEKDGKFTLNDGTITENRTPTRGGGVFVEKDGTFEMTGGQISDNKGYWGGGVCSDGTFIMTGGTITDNISEWGGGGVASDKKEGIFNVSGTADISENKTLNPIVSPYLKYDGYGDGVHNWGEFVETRPATAEQDGEESRTCPHCNKTETRPIPYVAPDVPEIPDIPETPETPDTPEIPDTPDIPDDGADDDGGYTPAVTVIEDQEVPLAGLLPLHQLLEAVPIGADTHLDGKFFVWLRQKLLKSVRIPASFFLARQKFSSPICIPSPIGTAS